jgi:hypothetical protein
MKTFKESEIKYLAGLLDADGSMSFKFCKTPTGKTYLYLVLAISASDKIDRQGYIKSLGDRTGSVCRVTYEKESYSDATKWHVQDRTALNKLVPRLTKHMLIKAKHWKRLHSLYEAYKGVDVTDKVGQLKRIQTLSRRLTGPLKSKNYPSTAWVAGYLDGDGCYSTKNGVPLHVGAISSTEDTIGLYLLQKSYGGSVYDPRSDNTQLWGRGLGVSHKSFAKDFLRKMVKHSRLKKHKIEQMLSFYNQPQRLSRNDPKG